MWSVTLGGRGRGDFCLVPHSMVPFREAILRSEMLSDSGWVPEARAQ